VSVAGPPVPEKAAPSSDEPASPPHAEGLHGFVGWAVLAVGWAVIAFAIHGLVADRANPPAVFELLVGLNVLNDAVVVPVVIILAVLVRRLAPAWAVVPVDVGLLVSAVVVIYAFPLVGSWGKSARAGTSRLPFDYAHSLLMVLGAVWVVCALWALWSWRRARSTAA